MQRHAVVFVILAAMLLPPVALGAAETSKAADALEGAKAKAERVHCLQGWESFLPGEYYACRALYHLQHKHSWQAVEMLKEAAYWANKDAQHALGLVYINGDIAGIATNRPMGVAWLALAAERKDPEYVRDYSMAAIASSPSEVARAARIYLRLREDYGDRTAGARAVHRFIRRIKPLDDAAAMGGNFAWVQGLSPIPQGALSLSRKIHRHADEYFEGLQGTVSVGALERVEAPSPALRDKYKQQPAKQGAPDPRD